MSEDERYTAEALALWSDWPDDEDRPELTADQRQQISDLVRYGRPVTDLPDVATYQP